MTFVKQLTKILWNTTTLKTAAN